MNTPTRLTNAAIQAALKQTRTEEIALHDPAVPCLSLRIYPSGTATWTQLIRVVGEGGVNKHGKKLLGRKHRLSLGNYPEVSPEAARAQANLHIDQAKRGINPKHKLAAAATAGGFTVEELSTRFLSEYVRSKGLDSVWLYENAFRTHINPHVGNEFAELFSREDARKVMNAARIKRPRPNGPRSRQIGGIEAARTAMQVLRHLFSWAIEEEMLKRQDNPCRNIIRHLPEKNTGEVVLSLRDARLVWQAAKDCGYPFGTHAQLMLLTGCRMDEWASANTDWIDLEEALMVIPAKSYKSDHVHVIPLVPQAIELLQALPKPTRGPYLLSSRRGRVPIRGVAKFFKTSLADQILANNGSRFTKRLTSHALRRTVATRLAEQLGSEGDKLVKRVLGHSDGSVTAIYNRYGYVREMREALTKWANELTAESVAEPYSRVRVDANPMKKKEIRDTLGPVVPAVRPQVKDLGGSIRDLIRPLGGVDLKIAPREAMPEPPDFGR